MNLTGKYTVSGIPEIDRIDEWNKLSQEEGIAFEYNDFFKPDVIDNSLEIDRRVEIYNSLGRDNSKDTLHGAFLDMTINSADKQIRDISRNRFEQSVSIAERLKCKGVVFHTNYLVGFKSERYKDNWVKSCAEYYHLLCEKHRGIDVYVENMFDNTPTLLKRLADECADIPNFGVCLDVAHAVLWYLPLEKWFDTLSPYIKHMHVNDNMLKEDDHLPVGDGRINFDFLKSERMKGIESVLLEVNGLEAFMKSLNYIKN